MQFESVCFHAWVLIFCGYSDRNNGRVCVFVSLWTDNRMGACGWSCQNHRTTGRKRSLTDGWQECRSGRRSRWERHKAFHTDCMWFLRVLKCAVLPKHGLGRLRGAACGSPGGKQDIQDEAMKRTTTEAERDDWQDQLLGKCLTV